MNEIRASLGFKGENGDSAYAVALKNGFVGSEQDWLATLGTSSHLSHDTETYTTIAEDEDTFDLPVEYTSNSYLEVYVNGLKLDSEEYSIDTTNNTVTLSTPLEVIGTKVEVVLNTMTTNELPITSTINSSSTNSTAAGTLSVYQGLSSKIEVPTTLIMPYDPVPAGETIIMETNYPSNWNRNNTILIQKKICTNSSGYYDTSNSNIVIQNHSLPIIDLVMFDYDNIKVWIKNGTTINSQGGEVRLAITKL